MNSYRTGLILLLAALLSGCNTKESSRGFSLPVGNADNGKVVFAELQCHMCHTVSGEKFAGAENQPQVLNVALGGEVTRIKTYGELVTSIINPSHRLASSGTEQVAVDGRSKMTNYNDVMTVRQLIDLVAFLQSRYKLERYDPSEYPVFMNEPPPGQKGQ